jgi:hypothetical protein
MFLTSPLTFCLNGGKRPDCNFSKIGFQVYHRGDCRIQSKVRAIASDVGNICRLHQAPECAAIGMAVTQETSFRRLKFNGRCHTRRALSRRQDRVQSFVISGSNSFVHIPKDLHKKRDSRSKGYVFVGYCNKTKGYHLDYPFNPTKDI